MKRFLLFLLMSVLLLTMAACGREIPPAQIAATTLPVYDFTLRLCDGTGLRVTRLVTEQVSCLHDYTLNVSQVKAAEAAEHIVISGAGLEDFLDGVLQNASVIDASQGIALLCPEEEHDHNHGHEGHHHEQDPHIWLSPVHAAAMARNICQGLSQAYPQHESVFASNLEALTMELAALDAYGTKTLSSLSCRELIPFHDGFSYFADHFGLHILQAIEEESGSEASAAELIHLIEEVENHRLPAIFTEKSGSVSAAGILSRETGCAVYALDMAMSGGSYFDAMYYNINTIKEALG